MINKIGRQTADRGPVSSVLYQYALEEYGYSQSLWASLTGRDESMVSGEVRDEE